MTSLSQPAFKAIRFWKFIGSFPSHLKIAGFQCNHSSPIFLIILSLHIVDACWHISFSDLLRRESFQKQIGMEVSYKLDILENCESSLGRLSYNEVEDFGDGFEGEKLRVRRSITMKGKDGEDGVGRSPRLREVWLVLPYSVSTLESHLPHL